MKHMINIPIECEDDYIGTDIEDNNITLEFFYHREIRECSNVIVYIHDTAFHGKCISSYRSGSCFIIEVRIKESFKLRMVEQVLRIENSNLSPEEWIAEFAADFPES